MPDLTRYKANCDACQSLCCVGHSFQTQHGFPSHKPAGVPCEHLDQQAFRCRIVSDRKSYGYHGCGPYDCGGAGQTITALMESRRHRWTDLPSDAATAYFNDLNTLFRIHFLILALHKGIARDQSLLGVLEKLSEDYEQGQTTSLHASFVKCVETHRDTVGAILQHVGYKG